MLILPQGGSILDAHFQTCRPANDFARIQIENCTQICKALFRIDIGDVGQPDLIWLLSHKLLAQKIRSDRQFVVGISGRNLESLADSCFDIFLMHQPGNRIDAARIAIFQQKLVHSRAAVIVKSLGAMDFPDFPHDFHLFQSRFAWLSFQVFVVAGTGDTQGSALDLNGPVRLMLFDEIEYHF